MGARRFDRKFGGDWLRELPEGPGVYLFKDDAGQVLYAGKAKNVRRRLSGYRNATRRKAHRKMRALVREAETLEVRPMPSEEQALLVENELIRTLRPRFNVDAAFAFLYPAIGTGWHDRRLLLAFTSRPDDHAPLGLRWHGSFRPRLRAREAFHALLDLLARVGHREPRSRLPEAPRRRGELLAAFRRTPPELLGEVRRFLDGEGDTLLAHLFERLLESPAARRDAATVQASLDALARFYTEGARRLRDARVATGYPARFVPQVERDALFIRERALRTQAIGREPPDRSRAPRGLRTKRTTGSSKR